jgi:hypothetical protein
MTIGDRVTSVLLWPITATLKKISLRLLTYADRKVEKAARKQGTQFSPEMDEYRRNMDKLRDVVENNGHTADAAE